MIKRIIGAVFALCVLAVIVFTVLGHGSYRSLISTADSVESAEGASPAEAQAAPEDKEHGGMWAGMRLTRGRVCA